MAKRNPSGIDFHPDESAGEEPDIELDVELASAAQIQSQPHVRHDTAPAVDPDALRSRVDWNDTSAPKPNAAIGPAFAALLILIVLAAIAASWWMFQPSDDTVKVREYIKTQTF